MKIAVVAPSPIGFLIGGAEKLFMGMLSNLNRLSNHDVELIKIPCRDQEFWSLIKGYRQFSKLDLDHFDMVITTKYPAWMVKHHNHMIYLQHTCRGLYDLYHMSGKSKDWKKVIEKDSRLAELGRLLNAKPDRCLLEDLFEELDYLKKIRTGLPPRTFEYPGPLIRRVIHFLDAVAMLPASGANSFGIKSYNAISENVALRKDYFPAGVEVGIIHHPTDLEHLHSASHDFIFTASRLENLKRVDLLIKAFKKVRTDTRFLIAGTGGREKEFKALAKKDPRIQFLGFVTDIELVEYYANALFVPFIPYDEDYGLITIEAMKSEKAVLTTSDAGGPMELVTHDVNGLVVESDVESLARAMQQLVDDREKTIKMGKNAKQTVAGIDWKSLSVQLLDNQAPDKNSDNASIRLRKIRTGALPEFPCLLVLSTFSVYPPMSGGKLRLYHLYKELARHCRVIMLSLDFQHGGTTEISDNFTEIRMKAGPDFLNYVNTVRDETGVSSDDIAAIRGYGKIPDFKDQLDRLLPRADVVVLAHPYFYYAVADVKKPIFYDAPNVEFHLKKAMFNNQNWLSQVRSVEQDLCNRANLVYTASSQDMLAMKTLYNVDEGKCFVAENGVDTSSIRVLSPVEKKKLKTRLGFGGRTAAVFAGSMHKPNEEAVLYIQDLAASFPDVLFIIIGEAGDVLTRPTKNMIPVGIVSKADKDVLMSAADIGLNPIISGSGTNLKLVEYLAYGLAVLSTDFGARGFDCKNELFTCKIDDFKREFGALSDRLQDLSGLSLRARQLAEKYDWIKISSKLQSRICECITS